MKTQENSSVTVHPPKHYAKPVKDHQLIQCTKNIIINTPTPNSFHRLFAPVEKTLLMDEEFTASVCEHMAKESTYKVLLQPEPTACKGVVAGKSEVVNRFLPKDFFRDFLIRKVKQLAIESGFKIKMPYADRCDKQ